MHRATKPRGEITIADVRIEGQKPDAGPEDPGRSGRGVMLATIAVLVAMLGFATHAYAAATLDRWSADVAQLLSNVSLNDVDQLSFTRPGVATELGLPVGSQVSTNGSDVVIEVERRVLSSTVCVVARGPQGGGVETVLESPGSC